MLDANHTRFGWVLEGHKRGPLPDCDVDLFDDPNFAVVPSLGSLVPGWLLVIPRRPLRCLAQLHAHEQAHLLSLAAQLREGMSSISSNVFMFEHGAGEAASSLNCGVDQAHLHIVPLAFDLLTTTASEATKFNWLSTTVSNPWNGISSQKDYYFVSDFERALCAQSVVPESQFFRKLIASRLGIAEAWDYKANPFPEIAKQTVEAVHFQRAA